MSKAVTIRLGENEYRRIKAAAEADNRPLSNFMETATLRFLDQAEFVDEQEMAEIRRDKELMKSLRAKVGRYSERPLQDCLRSLRPPSFASVCRLCRRPSNDASEKN
jgi:predicted transcriptional regulator